jgi:hypothetical protein
MSSAVSGRSATIDRVIVPAISTRLMRTRPSSGGSSAISSVPVPRSVTGFGRFAAICCAICCDVAAPGGAEVDALGAALPEAEDGASVAASPGKACSSPTSIACDGGIGPADQRATAFVAGCSTPLGRPAARGGASRSLGSAMPVRSGPRSLALPGCMSGGGASSVAPVARAYVSGRAPELGAGRAPGSAPRIGVGTMPSARSAATAGQSFEPPTEAGICVGADAAAGGAPGGASGTVPVRRTIMAESAGGPVPSSGNPGIAAIFIWTARDAVGPGDAGAVTSRRDAPV